MAKKPSIDFKQLLMQKGEKLGFIACAVALLAMIGLGGYTASSSASTSQINDDFKKGVNAVESKIQNGPADLQPVDPVVNQRAKTEVIAFTDYKTPNPFFGKIENVQPRRVAPKLYPPVEAVAEFVRGTIGVFEIVKDPQTEEISIGILQQKKATQGNSIKNIKNLIKNKKGGKPKPPTPPQPPPGTLPGGGLPGGGPPGAGPGRGGGGGRGDGGDFGGGIRATDQQVEYLKIDDPKVDQAKWAETILPQRMVVVTGGVPFRKQVEEYARALRVRTVNELQAADLPLYKSFNVERMIVAANGKPVEDPQWERLDLTNEAMKELYAIRLVNTEPEMYDRDRTLAQTYLERVVPEDIHRLVMPRPKLVRGKYEVPELKSVDEALKKIKEEGGLAKRPPSSIKSKMDEFDPFNRTSSQRQGGAGGDMPGGDRGLPGGDRGLPGGDRGRPNLGNRLPGGDAPGGVGQPQGLLLPEETWLMRFIDITVEPGFSYKYRVQLRAANPNYKRPVAELAYPGLADKEELEPSGWFTVAGQVDVPRDQNVYAAAGAGDDKTNRATERVSNTDDTYIQVQQWFDYVRLPGLVRPEPLGEWLSADIKATRGQYIGETARLKLPIWSLENGAFMLREQKTRAPGARRADVTWPVDIIPLPQMLLVDFEGGRGSVVVTKPFSSRQTTVSDTGSNDLLLLTEAPEGLKLQVYRSTLDVKDTIRSEREAAWKKWVDEVEAATRQLRQGGGNLPGGGLPGGGPPGGSSGG